MLNRKQTGYRASNLVDQPKLWEARFEWVYPVLTCLPSNKSKAGSAPTHHPKSTHTRKDRTAIRSHTHELKLSWTTSSWDTMGHRYLWRRLNNNNIREWQHCILEVQDIGGSLAVLFYLRTFVNQVLMYYEEETSYTFNQCITKSTTRSKLKKER